MKTYKYFTRISLPFFSETAVIPCTRAFTAYEAWICDEVINY